MKKTLCFLLFCAVTLSQSASATIPILYWDNQEGFVEAKGCGISQVEGHRFRISSFSGRNKSLTENLRNHAGAKQSHLIINSLVKIVEGKEKRNYKKIEVVGVNQGTKAKQNRWFSERLDQGYLFHNSILPAEDYIIRILNASRAHKVGNVFKSSQGKYLKLAAEGNFFQLNCENFNDRKYLVFKMYDKHSTEPDALVGIYWDETSIFRNIQTYTKYDALPFLPNNLDEESIDALLLDGEFNPEDAQSAPEVTEETTPIVLSLPEEIAPVILSTDPHVIEGAMENIVCTENSLLHVRDESLRNIIFTAPLGETVKVFQGWNNEPKKLFVDGTEYTFIKVQFADREAQDQQVGWVAQSYIKPKSNCKFSGSPQVVINFVPSKITGLDDPKCCEFPTVKRPTHDFASGMRKFRAGRGGGTRLHAACDLYRYKDEPINSVAPGVVVRNKYFFYQGTYALEVVHSGGFVVRYGELTSRNAAGIKAGAQVTMGQRIGYMGKVNSNCCRPMLHFELYKGTKSGSLSRSGNAFRRRSDLMDPTNYLKLWESKKF